MYGLGIGRKMVSGERLSELQFILKEEYGREVSLEEASEVAINLIGYFDLLAKVYHRDKVEI
jgi:hypothetical protein